MNAKQAVTIDHKKGVMRIAAIVVLILSIPLIAMQFSEEVQWGAADFIIIGALLFGFGMIYEFGVRSIKNASYRIALTYGLIIAVLLIWVQLAVGIFD